MSYGRDVQPLESFLHEASSENSNEPTSHPSSPVRTSSSPAILELSKNGSRYQDNGSRQIPLRKHLTRSCPQVLSEETPLNSSSESSEQHQNNGENGQNNGGNDDNGENDQNGENGPDNEEQVDNRWLTYCTAVINFCRDSIIEFRNSKYIYFIQFLFSLLPISAVIMGIMYVDKCHETPYMPIFGAIIGIIGIVFMGYWIVLTVCQRRGAPCFHLQNFIFGFLFMTLLFLIAIDMHHLSDMLPSFDESDKNYCNKDFYHYVILKEIMTAVALLLAAVFYLPGNLHCSYNFNCFTREPVLPRVYYHQI